MHDSETLKTLRDNNDGKRIKIQTLGIKKEPLGSF